MESNTNDTVSTATKSAKVALPQDTEILSALDAVFDDRDGKRLTTPELVAFAVAAFPAARGTATQVKRVVKEALSSGKLLGVRGRKGEIKRISPLSA